MGHFLNRSQSNSRHLRFATIVALQMGLAWAHAAGAGQLSQAAVQTALSEIVTKQTTEADQRFAGWVAPGQYGDRTGQSPTQNSTEAVRRITSEISQIYFAFASAEDGERAHAAYDRFRRLHPDATNDRASRLFPAGLTPPANWIRQIEVLPVSQLGSLPVERVFREVTTFDLLPKPDDTFFAYSRAFDLQGGVRELRGARGSHLANGSALVEGEPVALKKCRHVFLLGWYCNTNHYLASTVNLPADEPSDPARVVVTTLVDLTRNADDPQFAARGQNENTAQGYTAVTLVARAGDSVLVYFSGIQHTDSIPAIPGYQEKLNDGHKQEAAQLMERLRQRLNLK